VSAFSGQRMTDLFREGKSYFEIFFIFQKKHPETEKKNLIRKKIFFLKTIAKNRMKVTFFEKKLRTFGMKHSIRK
jgi:hypothetical protein